MMTEDLGAFDLDNIQQYSKRNVSYEDDSLKALTGIIKYFSVKDGPVRQLSGVPYLGHDSSRDGKTVQDLCRGLVWVFYGQVTPPESSTGK